MSSKSCKLGYYRDMKGNRTGRGSFQRQGIEPLAKKPVMARLPVSIDTTVRELAGDNLSDWLRSAIAEKLEREQCDRSDTLAELLTSEIELPELEGSQKQIEWAESIRMQLVAKLKQSNKEMPNWVLTETSAKFWIDNRAKVQGK